MRVRYPLRHNFTFCYLVKHDPPCSFANADALRPPRTSTHDCTAAPYDKTRKVFPIDEPAPAGNLSGLSRFSSLANSLKPKFSPSHL